ncbi:oligosaccharide flippase family protein [Mucilaginibacter ginsenosidivorax]|uniref:Oligosaccharide flippase family protein n=1 Tax=Mucilaginibacter ginsenosidivorax TaxID=862126 RepID=A0A5B8VX17_9SPHI|nr:oligosaccharide flippase family protein [Mucilaginibacter ginsenosidivorax]QEC74788.1 oligosaccharide flippase family protein [Mucilaginibacter ginsenosidivorax]
MTLLKKIFQSQDARSKTVAKNVFFSLFIKIANILINFLTIPLVLSFLNTTQYGIWLTLTAVLGWFSLFDLGFGNGLRNHLTISISKNNDIESKIYVSTTYAALSVIFGILIIIFLLINPFIDWTLVFNAPAKMSRDLNNAVLIAICLLFVQFVLRLINTVLLSVQRSAMADFINSLVQLLILGGIFFLKTTKNNSLTAIAIVYSITPIIVFLLISFILFVKRYKFLTPSIKFVRVSYAKNLLQIGLNFFIIQIAALVLYASDNFIIAQLFAPADVTVYNISFKYFSIINILFTIIMVPFWSMTTHSFAAGDYSWIKKTVKKLVFIWGILAICCMVQAAVANPLYKLWTNNKVLVPLNLTIVMCVYVITTNWGAIFSNFLNGVGKVRVQLYLSIGGMIINIPMAVFFVRYCHAGIIGIPLATIITMIIANIFSSIQYKKIISATATGIWNK